MLLTEIDALRDELEAFITRSETARARLLEASTHALVTLEDLAAGQDPKLLKGHILRSVSLLKAALGKEGYSE